MQYIIPVVPGVTNLNGLSQKYMILHRTAKFRFVLFTCFVSFCSALPAQKDPEAIRESIRYDIYRLADDSLLGRKSGFPGEAAAARYIAQEFREAGLKPAGADPGSYFQPFPLGDFSYTGVRLAINGEQCQRGIDFGAVAGSGNGKIQTRSIREVVISGTDSHDSRAHVVLLDMERTKNLKQLEEKIFEISGAGASAVLLFNADRKIFENYLFNPDSMPVCPVPVLYVTRDVVKKLRQSPDADIELSVKVGRDRKLSANVIGLLDAGSDRTVLIGGHYDHVGYQTKGEDTLVYNGADDNASGTAGVLELARLLGKENDLKCNYLFIAFSSEEAGLLGSKHFCNSPLLNRKDVSWMLNLDMIGRLAWNGKNRLTVMGTASSKAWNPLFRRIPVQGMKLVRIKGAPPYSDHFPFLQKKIPLIYFTTGLHKNYHKFSDDADSINFEGETAIIRYLHQLILGMDKEQKPVFRNVNGVHQVVAFIRLFMIR